MVRSSGEGLGCYVTRCLGTYNLSEEKTTKGNVTLKMST